MSAKKDLKKLMSGKLPEPSELRAQFEAMDDDTDRAIGVVSVAIIEAILQRLLEVRLKGQSPEVRNGLFLNRGPLSDFHGKILVAVGFDVASAGIGDELMNIKAIRNAFAHSTMNIGFDTPEIVGLLRESKILQIIAGPPEPSDGGTYGKIGFLKLAKILCLVLNSAITEAGGDPVYH